MINANLTGNLDYDTEIQALDRKRQLANLLTMASMRGINPSRGSERGGYVVPYQSSEGMAKIAQALSGALGTYAADKQQQDLAQSRNQALADAYSSGEGGMPDEEKLAFAAPDDYRKLKLAQALSSTRAGGVHLVNSTPINVDGKQVLLQQFSNGDTRIAGDEVGTPYIVNPRNLPIGLQAKTDENGNVRVDPYTGAPESTTTMEEAKNKGDWVEVTLPDQSKMWMQKGQLKQYQNPENQGLPPSKPLTPSDTGTQPSNDDYHRRWAEMAIDHIKKVETGSGSGVGAVSPKGALGPYQILPTTAKDPGFGIQPITLEETNDPVKARKFAVDYLAALHRTLGSDSVAIDAYNNGVGNVQKGIVPNKAYRQQVFNASPIPIKSMGLQEQELVKAEIETQAKAEQERQSAAIKQETAGPIKVAEQVGEAQGKMKAALPKTLAEAQYSIEVLNKVLNHPGLSGVVGMPDLMTGLVNIPGTKEASFRELLKQVQGRTFLQAYDTLKGGGQITEIEGEKAQQAIARLGTSQTEEDFKEAVMELRGILEKGMHRAKEMAGQPGQLDQLRDNMPPPEKRGFKLSPGQQKQADELENQFDNPPKDLKKRADEIRKELGL